MSEEKNQQAAQMDPMKMMEKMKGMMGEGFAPMEMCKQMIQSVQRASDMATYATPELRGLFDDWLEQVEAETLKFIAETGSIAADEVAKKLGLSVESTVFLLSKLGREGKLEISARARQDKGS
jgi:uncharacterized membrane protein